MTTKLCSVVTYHEVTYSLIRSHKVAWPFDHVVLQDVLQVSSIKLLDSLGS